jgi:hypothetical protein
MQYSEEKSVSAYGKDDCGFPVGDNTAVDCAMPVSTNAAVDCAKRISVYADIPDDCLLFMLEEAGVPDNGGNGS